MTLSREHRPKTLEELVGNKPIKDSLESIFSRKSDFPHAYLFHGQTGCGKTTLARIVANLLGAEDSAIEEFDTAKMRGIDTVRDITESCVYSPMEGRVRVYILDECHRQTKDAKEGLLKLLEEPPDHVYFILCTTNPEELLPTMIGRCHSYQVKSLKSTEMMELLKSVLKKEKIEDYPDTVLKEIVKLSEGLPRNALVLLDSVIDIEDEKNAVEALSSVSLSDADTKALCNDLVSGKSWDMIRNNVKSVLKDNEAEKFRYAILGYLSAVLYNSKNNDRVSEMMEILGNNTYSSGKPGLQNLIYQCTLLNRNTGK